MTLALIEGSAIVQNVVPGSGFNLPNGDRVSPALDGWTNGIHRLATVVEADPVPDGKLIVSTDAEMVV